MAKKWVVSLEIWNNPSPKAIKIEQSTLEKVIRSLSSEKCADLLIDDVKDDSGDGFVEGFPTFIINACEGKYSVSALLDEDNCYDLVGDPAATGLIDFLIGGQETPLPRKYLVSMEQAIAAANAYLEVGEAIITKYSWDSQQDSHSAWNF